MMKMMKMFLIVIAAACLINSCESESGITDAKENSLDPVQQFEKELDQLRQQRAIPGLAAAVVKGEEIIFAEGYGYADVGNKIPVTENTPFHIASITKTFTSALIMQLVEEGKLELDDAMAEILSDTDFPFPDGTEHGFADACGKIRSWAEDPSSPYFYVLRDYHCDLFPITVRHHLTHTSEGVPGSYYRYSGALYGILEFVVETVSGTDFRSLLAERIIDPLGMTGTIPSLNNAQEQAVINKCAKSYIVNSNGIAIPSECESCNEISASAGMASTVLDLAKYSIALDRNRILSAESKEKMFTRNISNNGKALPYGLGWFVQYSNAGKLVWHYGWQPDAYSTLILKAVDKDLTLILLANSDGLSASYNLGEGNVLNSPFALSFLSTVAQNN